jgi:hypothetical protein
MLNQLPPEKLRRKAEPNGIRSETTKELTPLEGIIDANAILTGENLSGDVNGEKN